MATLPTPIRAALGLAATAIDEARKLPETLPQLPVTVLGTAMQASLRVQQHIAEYAARGDELLSQLRGTPDEPPSWATFDDDAATSGAASAKAAFELIDEADAVAEADELVQPAARPSAGPAGAGVPATTATPATAKAAPAKKAAPAPKAGPVTKAAPAGAAKKAGAKKAAATKSAKKPGPKAPRSEPLARAAERARPTDAPNPSVLAAEIVQAHQHESE